tara:strand:+ start:245 stop:988 length:744 start_codon:yes stop_codon:yes gene_type:complete
MKVLLTSGCSFSDIKYTKTWPNWLELHVSPQVAKHTGSSSQGNDLIAKKTIYACNELLKEYKGEDILCVVQWSSYTRMALLNEYESDMRKEISKQDKVMHWFRNQFKDYDDKTNKQEPFYGWNIINSNWNIKDTMLHYKNQSVFGMVEQTLWHMLNVKNFCEVNNINYCWTTMQNDVNTNFAKHWSTKHLYDLVYNTDNRISKLGIYEWVTQSYPEEFQQDELHPTEKAHKLYTEEEIIPFVENNEL